MTSPTRRASGRATALRVHHLSCDQQQAALPSQGSSTVAVGESPAVYRTTSVAGLVAVRLASAIVLAFSPGVQDVVGPCPYRSCLARFHVSWGDRSGRWKAPAAREGVSAGGRNRSRCAAGLSGRAAPFAGAPGRRGAGPRARAWSPNRCRTVRSGPLSARRRAARTGSYRPGSRPLPRPGRPARSRLCPGAPGRTGRAGRGRAVGQSFGMTRSPAALHRLPVLVEFGEDGHLGSASCKCGSACPSSWARPASTAAPRCNCPVTTRCRDSSACPSVDNPWGTSR
jgi:hypothetical protein